MLKMLGVYLSPRGNAAAAELAYLRLENPLPNNCFGWYRMLLLSSFFHLCILYTYTSQL